MRRNRRGKVWRRLSSPTSAARSTCCSASCKPKPEATSSKQSGVGCRIFEKNLPIDYQTAVMAEEMNMNVTTCALNGGEDYELVFTVPIGDREKVEAIDDVKLIGYITDQKYGHILVSRDGQEFELKAQGWNFAH